MASACNPYRLKDCPNKVPNGSAKRRLPSYFNAWIHERSGSSYIQTANNAFKPGGLNRHFLHTKPTSKAVLPQAGQHRGGNGLNCAMQEEQSTVPFRSQRTQCGGKTVSNRCWLPRCISRNMGCFFTRQAPTSTRNASEENT